MIENRPFALNHIGKKHDCSSSRMIQKQ